MSKAIKMPEIVISDSRSMCTFLVKSMVCVVEGTLEPARYTAITNGAQQIYNFMNLELKAAKLVAELGIEAIKPVEFHDDH